VKRVLLVAAAVALAVSCGGAERERAKATALQHGLQELRKAIHDYREDKGQPPQTLQDLARTKYIFVVPKDPMTGKADWRVTVEQPVRADDFQKSEGTPSKGGIVDVHSNAPGTDPNGRAWSEY